MKCLNCGKELNSRQHKYCSNTCQAEHQYNQWIQRWQSGEELGVRGQLVSKHIKRYLFNKYKNSCARCGWNQVNPFTGNLPLEIEHIDGNYTNNKEDNLILLCQNCHSLTATYKGANRGHGRTSRRKKTD